MGESIEEGYGLEDVSCPHGSRWIWWPGLDGKGEWMNVIRSSDCDCGEPPRPKQEAEPASEEG